MTKVDNDTLSIAPVTGRLVHRLREGIDNGLAGISEAETAMDQAADAIEQLQAALNCYAEEQAILRNAIKEAVKLVWTSPTQAESILSRAAGLRR